MSTTVRDRLGAMTGAAFVMLILVGNQMATAGAAKSAHPTRKSSDLLILLSAPAPGPGHRPCVRRAGQEGLRHHREQGLVDPAATPAGWRRTSRAAAWLTPSFRSPLPS